MQTAAQVATRSEVACEEEGQAACEEEAEEERAKEERAEAERAEAEGSTRPDRAGAGAGSTGPGAPSHASTIQ